MEKYFCNYNQALALKELGFDEPCFGCYTKDKEISYDISDNKVDGHYFQECAAPLRSQVFEWFRDKHNLVIEPCVHFQRTYQTEDDYFEILEFGYRIFEFDQFRGGRRNTIEWDGYENSFEDIAESKCIDKLIEIAKNK